MVRESSNSNKHKITAPLTFVLAEGSPDPFRDSQGFRKIFEHTTVGIAILGLDESLLDFNPAFYRMLGYEQKELVDIEFSNLIKSDDLAEQKQTFKSIVLGEIDNANEPLRLVHKSGHELWIEANYSLVREESGRPWYVVATFNDVTEKKHIEAQVQANVKRTEQLCRAVPTAVITLDRDRNITFMNPWAEKTLGYTQEEVVGKNYSILEFTPISQQINHGISNMVQVVGTLEYSVKTKEGHILTAIKNESLIGELGDEYEGIIVSFIDITGWKSTEREFEKQLKEGLFINRVIAHAISTKELSLVLDGIMAELGYFFKVPRVVFSVIDTKKLTARVISEYCEKGCPKRLGETMPINNYPYLSYLIEQRTPLIISDARIDPLVASRREWFIENGIYSVLLVPLTVDMKTIGVLELDFSYREQFEGDETELIQRTATQIIHVLDKKRAEQAIQAQRDFALKIMNTMGQGLAVVDLKGRIEYVNPAFAKMLGYPAKEMVGMLTFELTSEKDLSRVKESYQKRSKGLGDTYEVELKEVDGSTIPVLIASVPNWRNNQLVGSISVITDLTDRKKIERELAAARDQALEAARIKADFLANMSHEIRTPLNAIIGMTGLLMETPLSREQMDFVESVSISGDTLLMLINDILDFSKIEVGKMVLENEPFDLIDCVEDALQVLAPKAAEKGLELAYLIDDSVPINLTGDVGRLRQVLVNLVGNAVKFTEQGEVVVAVTNNAGPSMESKQGKQDQDLELHFTVKDTGIGIPKDKIKGLFNAFTQVDASTTRKFGGTGLGLSISRRLVEMMDGKIWVESQVGQGSVFHFTVRTQVAATVPDEDKRKVGPELAGRRILIVDDNETNRFILTKQVQSWSMIPTAVASGREAWRWIRNGEKFDIAILDMQMPGMDGEMLATEIRKHRSKKELPLVMLTSLGNHGGNERRDLYSAYLTKPVKSSRLHDTLVNVLSEKKQPTKQLVSKWDMDREMGSKHPLRILVADDNSINLSVAKAMLKRLGYDPDVAMNGFQVLEAMKDKKYDVVLLDVEMPELDGIETTRLIRQNWEAEDQPRIIAMTAHALQGDKERFLGDGMDDYLSKPVRLQSIVKALSKSVALDSTDQRAQVNGDGFDPAVDQKIISDFKELMGDMTQSFLNDLVKDYEEQGGGLIRDIQNAISQKDSTELQLKAHKLKGGSGTLGAIQVQKLAAEIETASKEAEFLKAAKLFGKLENEFNRSLIALKEVKY